MFKTKCLCPLICLGKSYYHSHMLLNWFITDIMEKKKKKKNSITRIRANEEKWAVMGFSFSSSNNNKCTAQYFP